MKHHSREKKISILSLVVLAVVIIVFALVCALRTPSPSRPSQTIFKGPTDDIGPPGVTLKQIKMMGEPYIGSVTAPVTIVYWCDYQSLFCKQGEENVLPLIVKDYVDTGKVKIIFKDFPFVGTDSETLAVDARAVYVVAPDKFYDWHKAIFDAQSSTGSSWASASNISTITSKVLGADDSAKVFSLVKSNSSTYANEIAADKAEGINLGTGAIPAMLIGKQLLIGTKSYSVVKASIDTALQS